MLLFDIQHFSIHNGPGIRTTVFFKGCPLNCMWCHNPESISSKRERVFRDERCINCGRCLAVCPHLADGALPLNDSCGDCKLCIEGCPTNALELFGRQYSAEELLTEIQKDDVFYQKSGGGVTLSGGEPLFQGEELIKLMSLIKANQTTLALDTSGYAPWDLLQKTLPYVDLYLFDVKHLIDSEHRKGTGVGVSLIVENYKKLHQSFAKLWVRVPVIPGFNMDAETIEQLIAFLTLYPPEQINLLPYHQNALRKYQLLHKGLPDFVKPEDYTEQLEKIMPKFRNAGLICTIGG